MPNSSLPLHQVEQAAARGAFSPAVSLSSPSRAAAWLRIAALSLLALLAISGGVTYGIYASWARGDKIAPNVVVQGEPVGGLTRAEARQRLQRRFGRLFITVQTPQRPYRLSLRQLGGQPQISRAVNNAFWNGRSGSLPLNVWRLLAARREEKRLPLSVRWDKARLRRTMWTVATSYAQAPRDARLQVADEGVQVIAHEAGRSLNVGETLRQLQKKYYAGLPQVPATVRRTQPRLTAASLDGSDIKLGQYSTRFDSGLWGRTRNIRVAASEMNGKVLMPGQTFSFNGATGERTWDKGYRMAHIFETKPGASHAEVVDGLAGGVCQVSSTLYNAVRKSNRQAGGALKIVERNYHSLPVTYVPSGFDATVAWPSKDFKFRNTFHHPIYLRAAVRGSRLVVSVWGRVPHDAVTAPAEETGGRQARGF